MSKIRNSSVEQFFNALPKTKEAKNAKKIIQKELEQIYDDFLRDGQEKNIAILNAGKYEFDFANKFPHLISNKTFEQQLFEASQIMALSEIVCTLCKIILGILIFLNNYFEDSLVLPDTLLFNIFVTLFLIVLHLSLLIFSTRPDRLISTDVKKYIISQKKSALKFSTLRANYFLFSFSYVVFAILLFSIWGLIELISL